MLRAILSIYTDVSALTQFNQPGVLKLALTRPEFSGRLLYGTDFPPISTPLVSPRYSRHHSLRQKWAIWRTKNCWDIDSLMKHELGVSTETFARSAKRLKSTN